MSETPSQGTNAIGDAGQSPPGITQLTAFLDDGDSRLADLLRRFESRNCRLVSLSLKRELGYTIARFILVPSAAGRDVLERAGLPIVENLLLAVRLNFGPQPLLQVCLPLVREDVHVHSGQVLALADDNSSIALLAVSDIPRACGILRERGFHLMTEESLFGTGENP